ncbi:MAG: hypothetical protein K8R41_12760 [Bacteroidales bacterium]|nr:hypothetical protein [Bacteroidales bacterium]
MKLKIIETPRDGMQGIKKIIPTDVKADYINKLLKVGFDAVDIGSFVSSKAIPQLKDTAEVIKKLDLSGKTDLMVLVANKKGGEIASHFEEIKYLIYPFSISPTFLQRNINSDIESSLQNIEVLKNICLKTNKELVVYVAMGFGNPYGDEWNIEIVEKYVNILKQKEINIIPFSDILGNSTPERIKLVFSSLVYKFPEIEFGFHLHARFDDWYEKLDAAYTSGCRRFDSVINGLGGCPMADDKLLGNLDTKNLISYLDKNNIEHKLNRNALNFAVQKAQQIF